MSAKETVGGLTVLVFGLMIFFGIQFLSSEQTLGGTEITLSYFGIGMIIVGIVLIIWSIKYLLD